MPRTSFVPLHYEKVQYHTPRKLGRIDRHAAAHGLSSIRIRLVCCRSKNTLHDEVGWAEGARFTAYETFPHKARKGSGTSKTQADSASHLSS